MLNPSDRAGLDHIVQPRLVKRVTPQEVLHPCPSPETNRLELSNRPTSTHDREMLPAMLDRIKQVGEVPGRLGRTDLGHKIRLSDSVSEGGLEPPRDYLPLGPQPSASAYSATPT